MPTETASIETTSMLPAYLPYVITIATTVFTVLGTGLFALYQQRKNARESIKVSIYERVADSISVACEYLIKTNTAHISATIEGSLFWESLGSPHHAYAHVRHNLRTLIEAHSQASKAVNVLCMTLDRYSITADNFKCFTGMINIKHDEFQSVFMRHQGFARRILPSGMGVEDNSTELNRMMSEGVPTKDGIESFKKAQSEYGEIAIDLLSYLDDVSKSAQMHFLGSIFPDQLQYRTPLDPSVIVLKNDPQTLVQLKKILKEREDAFVKDWHANQKD